MTSTENTKVKKIKRKAGSMLPLDAQLEQDKVVQPKSYKASKVRRRQADQEPYVTKAVSARIMKTAAEQLDELDDETAAEGTRAGRTEMPSLGRTSLRNAAFQDQEDSDDGDGDQDYFSDEEHCQGDMEISAEDAAMIERFMNPEAGESRTLADLIMQRFEEHTAEVQAKQGGPRHQQGDPDMPAPRRVLPGVDQKVHEVYTEVGRLLTRYHAGKVPKAFKIIPALSNWEEVLFITNPEGWSAHAMYAATRLFASNLNPKMAQRFYNLVLLPACRADVKEHKRLHFALFQALKKAVYKPGAFYKGLLLPLCASGTCTVREAVIWSSLLARISIPVLHSSVAILKIAEMPYSGTNSFFLLQMLNKKYALPHRVIDALVDHFCKFEGEERALPVIWHQSLLTFVQRYKQDIKAEDKQRLKAVVKEHAHYLVTAEIKRELGQGLSRGEKAQDAAAMSVDPMALGTATQENLKSMPPVVMDEDI